MTALCPTSFRISVMTRRVALLMAVPLTVHLNFLASRRCSSLARSAFGRKPKAVVETGISNGPRRLLSGRYKEKLKPLDANGKFVDTHCHLDMVIPRLSRQSHEDRNKTNKLWKRFYNLYFTAKIYVCAFECVCFCQVSFLNTM